MNTLIAGFSIVMGIGFFAIWTRDILANPDIDLSPGFFRARDKDSGVIFWFHWLAEYGTGVILVGGGVGLVLGTEWAKDLELLGMGALAYTSVNSLGWVFARRERMPYGIPMLVGVAGALASAIWLLAS